MGRTVFIFLFFSGLLRLQAHFTGCLWLAESPAPEGQGRGFSEDERFHAI